MCGLAGFLDTRHRLPEPETCLRAITDTLAHRGPDDQGYWFDPDSGVGLGHRRLAIVDLSAEGHQPMVSSSGRYRIVYNGEVYNFASLRTELESHQCRFRGHSDTEVLLAAIETWGLEATLQRSVGMFALALWDAEERTITLVRDRLGIKPLYYGIVDGCLVFGSELKALRRLPGFDASIDREALALQIRHGYVPAPHTIYRGIFKLPPGTWLRYRQGELPAPVAFWDTYAEATDVTPFQGSPGEAVDAVHDTLKDAVGLRMVADVPLGAFLSGGIDSSVVVALMQTQSSRPVKTFSIGFHETNFDEAPHAKAVAQHLGTDHTELYVTPEEAQAVIPKLPTFYDEPFADSSQIPTFLVSQLARRYVTVSLSGDGGDELFFGYQRYYQAQRIHRTLGHIPAPLSQFGSQLLESLSVDNWERLLGYLPRPKRLTGDRLHKLAHLLRHQQSGLFYRQLMSIGVDPLEVVLTEQEAVSLHTAPRAGRLDAELGMMVNDLLMYLPDDILTKVDRASMAVALEARVPILDHRLVRLALSLPLEYKFRDGQSKWALRQVLYRYVPQALLERPKMGFGVPIHSWLRGPLRDWAEALLAEDRLRAEGFFQVATVRRYWQEHLAGHDWSYFLWSVLMFQSWYEQQRLPTS